MNAKQIWQISMERLQTKVSSAAFTTWFLGTSGHTYQDGIFTLRVPTTFARAQLENRFQETIRTVVADVTGMPVEIKFLVAKEQKAEPAGVAPDGLEAPPAPSKRPYRLGKGRLSAALRGKRNLETEAPSNTPVMNSFAPGAPQTPAYRSPHDEPEPVPMPSPYNRHDLQNVPETRVTGEGREEKPTRRATPEPFQGGDSGYSASPSFANMGLVEGLLLNQRYTFQSFIVGKSNQLAHAASIAVSENPGGIYNPLFLYGGVGLGKTHLLHAIGHAGESAGLHVLYTTSEKFTNEIINAIRFQKTEEFRAKYRQIDILLVDDIQFIAGKESTEEEFFHTFNTLHNANKQIVVTSDRPPKAINSLQDRLRSRFEWGLQADVQSPEYEHRLAILRSKADSMRFTIPSAVIEYIARPQCSNVRELEGALNRVIAYATLHDAPLTVSLATQALAHLYETKPPVTTLSVNEVLDGICRYYHIEVEMLRGKQRDKEIVWPRQVAMYLMREETSASLLQIGTALGGRDHTTIMHGWEKVRAEIANNDQARQEIAAVVEALHHSQI